MSLAQAQSLLKQVSPKLAADQAAIAASQYQTEAANSVDRPFVFGRVSASAYTLERDINLSSLKGNIVDRVDDFENSIPILPDLPLPIIPDLSDELDSRLPDNYDFKQSGSNTSAGIGVVWPVYTAGRSEALTGVMAARTQEATADQLMDQNELSTTLVERYFQAQLAIIAAYLRDDALDTIQQTDHMAQRLFEEGFISHVDRLEAQSALADAKSEAAQARNTARLAMIALQRLLRTEARVRPTTPLFVSTKPLPDVRYFQAQLAIIAAYLRDDALDTIQQTDHMAQRLFEEGFISHVDRLEAQSALADAKSEAAQARNTARLAMIALQRLLRTEARVRPTTPLFVSTKPLPDVRYFQDLALARHPGLQKVAAKQQQANKLHELSDTGYKPTVLMYGYGQLDRKPSWIAGVSATWKLGGGLDKGATLAASEAKIRQADLTKIDVSDNLLLLVEKNWNDVNNAQSRYQALQSNVDLAAEVLRLRRLGLQEGVNTTIDVVQSQTKYLKARTEQAQAANDYVQALAALLNSAGVPEAFNTYMNAADIHLPTLYDPNAPLP